MIDLSGPFMDRLISEHVPVRRVTVVQTFAWIEFHVETLSGARFIAIRIDPPNCWGSAWQARNQLSKAVDSVVKAWKLSLDEHQREALK